MKGFLLAATLLAGVLPAAAADVATPQNKQAYAAVPAPCSWCGAYGGVELAYGWNEIKANVFDEAKFEPNKFAPGFAVGYRWQFRDVVTGIEASGKWAGASDTIVDGVTGKLQYYGDLSAQLGLAINKGMAVYTLAGPSWANFKVCADDLCSTANYFGWHFGGGVDFKVLSENFIIGAQYKHHAWGEGSLFGVINTTAKNDEIVIRALYRFAH